ncbi:UNVERIFIED_ORG: hypothetical protein QIH99_gp15 [Proteus phage VB_PmiS-Isfahan]|uniref:Uncharacterized protein n=1 Tax=Proteus phage VB_PmiS-Isfahan TaxID=1969841 RepID=A0A1U9ZA51_9CAUD
MKNKIIALRKRGFKYDNICENLNVSKMYVAKVLKESGMTSNLWTKELLQKLEELCNDGYSNAEIAVKLSVTHAQVRNAKSKHGFKQALPKFKKDIIELANIYSSEETANILKLHRRTVQAVRTAYGVNHNKRYYMIRRAHKLYNQGMSIDDICKALNKKYQTVEDYLCTSINI